MVMPQLDIATFPSQIFWLIVTFSLLYLSVKLFILPGVKSFLASRDEFISSMEKQASDYRVKCEEYKKKYEDGINDAMIVAQDMMKDAELWMKQHQEDQTSAVDMKIKSMLSENKLEVLALKKSLESQCEDLASKIALCYCSVLIHDAAMLDSCSSKLERIIRKL